MGKNACPLPPPLAGKQGRGAARRRRRLSGGPGLGGVHGEGEKGEWASGNPFPTLIWAGAQLGGRSTAAGGDGQRWLRRRRCKAEEGARGAGQVCGGAEVRGVPIYRRGMAVARGGRRWPGSAAINGAPASRSGVVHDSRRRRDVSGSGTASKREASTWRWQQWRGAR